MKFKDETSKGDNVSMKRTISIILISMISAVLFIGCGDNSKKTTETQTEVKSTNEVETSNNSSTSQDTIKFEKTENEIKDDLIKNGTGFMETALSEHTFSYIETDSYKINQINEFKILSIEPDKESILNLTDVIISTNTDFTIKNQDDVLYENGNYNINGKFKVTYKLDKDENGNLAWIFYTPRLTSFSESKVTKK